MNSQPNHSPHSGLRTVPKPPKPIRTDTKAIIGIGIFAVNCDHRVSDRPTVLNREGPSQALSCRQRRPACRRANACMTDRTAWPTQSLARSRLPRCVAAINRAESLTGSHPARSTVEYTVNSVALALCPQEGDFIFKWDNAGNMLQRKVYYVLEVRSLPAPTARTAPECAWFACTAPHHA